MQFNDRLAVKSALLLLCLAAVNGVAQTRSNGLASAVTGRGGAARQAATIPFSDIGARATANYQGDALGVTATADGARLRCGFQKLAGHATPEGLWLQSTKPGGGQLRLVAVAVGRAEALASSAQCACAGGTSENSPAFQRWDRFGRVPSRQATAELAPRFSRPFGTSSVMRPNPALKQISRRGS